MIKFFVYGYYCTDYHENCYFKVNLPLTILGKTFFIVNDSMTLLIISKLLQTELHHKKAKKYVSQQMKQSQVYNFLRSNLDKIHNCKETNIEHKDRHNMPQIILAIPATFGHIHNSVSCSSICLL